MPITLHAIIERGPVELVEYFLWIRNENVIKKIKDYHKPTSDETAEHDLSCTNFELVEMNIDLLAPYITTWPQALVLLIEPKNIPHSASIFLQISDQLCIASGVKASRLDWFAERGTIIALYVITELYMLTDTSENYQETRLVA
jgi:ubiquinone biosynthesis protein COQ9